MKIATKISIGAIIPLTAGIITPIAVTVPGVRKSEGHLINFNDFHGAAPGYGDTLYAQHLSMPSGQDPGVIRMAKAIYDFTKAHPGTIALSAGDNNSGNAFSTSNHAQYLYPLLQAMDVRYSAVGNHAFEWGLPYMSDRSFDNLARTPKTEGNYFLAANILNDSKYQGKDTNYETWKEKRVNWADPYKIVDLNGHNICLIGLTTKLTKTDGNTAAIQDLSFINYNASVTYTKQYIIDTLGLEEFNKIDAFVLLTHVGSSYDNGKFTDEAFDLARDELTTQVDAIISSHSHKTGVGKVRNKNLGNDIWVGQAGTAGRALLDTAFVFDDNNAPGSRLKSVKMNIIYPDFDTAGVDMSRKDLTAEEKKKALNAATNQYNALIQYAASLPETEMFARLVDCYKEMRANVVWKLDSPACERDPEAKTEVDLDYHAKEACHMGHEYYAAKYINEPMGAWINKANIIGTDIIRKENHPEAPQPSISIINQDSITHSKLKDQKISVYDVYQLQTYENNIYQGVLTVGQLANIINYILSGGLISKEDIGVKDTSSVFTYGVDNKEYDKMDEIETDPITHDTIPLPELKDAKGRTTKLRYLCGPAQFYGFKFEIEALPQPEKTYDWKNIRQYKLAWENNAPKIWIYDPTSSQDHRDIDNIANWKQVGKDWPLDRYIPITINSFTFGGGNYQLSMMKSYMEFNAAKDPDNKAIQVYKYPAQFTRDAVMEYCKNFERGTYTLALPQDAIKQLVIYKQ